MLRFGHTITPIFLSVCACLHTVLYFSVNNVSCISAHIYPLCLQSTIETIFLKKRLVLKFKSLQQWNIRLSLQWVRKCEGFKSIETKRFPGKGEVTVVVTGAQTPEIKADFCRGVLQMILAANLQISLRC